MPLYLIIIIIIIIIKFSVPCKSHYLGRRYDGTRRCLHSRLACTYHRDRKWNKWMRTCCVDCALIIARDTGTSLEQQGIVYFHSTITALPVGWWACASG
jgi:hypothetical protein